MRKLRDASHSVLFAASVQREVMRESDEVNSFNGSYSLSCAPALSVSEQRLSDDPEALTNSSCTESHRFNVDHARVIPSLHTTIPSGYKYLQVHTLTKETVTLAVHVGLQLITSFQLLRYRRRWYTPWELLAIFSDNV